MSKCIVSCACCLQTNTTKIIRCIPKSVATILASAFAIITKCACWQAITYCYLQNVTAATSRVERKDHKKECSEREEHKTLLGGGGRSAGECCCFVHHGSVRFGSVSVCCVFCFVSFRLRHKNDFITVDNRLLVLLIGCFFGAD